MNKIGSLKPYLETLRRYRRLLSIVNFDLETICPVNGQEGEAELLPFLQQKIDEIYADDEFQNKLFELDKENLNPYERRLVDIHLREVNYLLTTTAEERAAIRKSYSRSLVEWRKARELNSYEYYLPYFEKVVASAQKEAEYRRKDESTLYEVCLYRSDLGLKEKDLDAVFSQLGEFIKQKLEQVARTPRTLNYVIMPTLSVSEQQKLAKKALNLIGFDFQSGASSESIHPFSDFLGIGDSRLTNRFDPTDWRSSLFTAFHEGGHCLQFQGWDQNHFDLHLENSASMANCETHSRFFENLLGRSYELAPTIMKMIEEIKGEPLQVSRRDFYRHLNQVCPSLIRTEADELTYSLHIIIRYEIERDLINGKLAPKDAKQAWKEKYAHYLGVEPSDDLHGILQDIHWTDGSFGYFPAYALGNLYGAQILERMGEDIDIAKQERQGDLKPILNWLQTHDFPYDCLSGDSWIKQVTGKPLSAEPFIRYLDSKYPIK